jgi:antitoxin VapB
MEGEAIAKVMQSRSEWRHLDLDICKAYASEYVARECAMKRPRTGKGKSVTPKTAARSMSSTVAKRASIFRNGANQAVRLPQELRFPADVKEVRIRKQGDGLFISPVKPNWSSFFAMQVDVPDDFLEKRNDSPPQSRDLL